MKLPSIKLAWPIGVMAALILPGATTFMLWPRSIATFQTSNGSLLVVRTVAFGTNHIWYRHAWQKAIWTRPFLRGEWQGICNQFKFALWRYRRTGPFELRTIRPSIAFWGEWRDQGQLANSLRFIVLDDTGNEIGMATGEWWIARPMVTAGLFASMAGSPSSSRLHVRVIED